MDPIQDTTENPRGFGGTPDPEPVTNADGEEYATEEQQLNYDMLVTRARKMIFGQSKEKILKQLGSSETPAKGMGKVGSMLIKSLMASSKQAGREISGDVAINAATEVVDDLNELGKVNKVFTYETPEDEKKELEDSLLWGIKFYGDGALANGEISQEMQKLATQEVKEGIASEGGPKKTPMAAGVGEAMNQSPGLVSGAMGGGY